MALLPVLRLPLQTVVIESLSGNKSYYAVRPSPWEDNKAVSTPIISLSQISSLSKAIL